MYLKSIEVQGFKSFAKKITFDFHEGITGIVGPNGSGKSNVADAVRWVLGEQRIKQLRGGSMQDVIFSGTESRKPLSFASVAITLDNSDHKLPVEFEEVTVTRKLYRSGESEYLINGSTCRLKDINEMFYDTGIGKEGYSIIGQGQIDKILSGKPEERRELFDEAAGIVKFKRRKNMSVKKLEDERQNLLRVNDILSELEKQIGPLEKQSAVAREYLKKKEELKTFDINMFLLEAARIKEQILELTNKEQIVERETKEANDNYVLLKEEYEIAEEEMDRIEDSIEKSKRQLNETNILKQQLEGQIEVLKEQINTVRMNDEHIGQRLKKIYDELNIRDEKKKTLVVEQNELEVQLQETKKRDEQAKNVLLEIQTQIAELSSDAENNKGSIIEILNNRASTKVKMQRYVTMLEQNQTRKFQIKNQIAALTGEEEQLQKQIAEYKNESKSVLESIRINKESILEIETKIGKIQAIISEYSNQLRIGQSAFHREQSRLESLKNITERYDGYGNSIRKVMEKKNDYKGLLGVVADLIKTEKAYEIAVETALGGSIQNIVTDTEETAKQMIRYLKTNKFGRATFLPLTSLNKGQGFRFQDALRENGVIGVASDLVQVEEKYKDLSIHLLGRTIVAENIDVGISLAKKYKQSLRIVTMEGELLNPGGAITGGAFKNTSNLLSRRREIEEFEKSVKLLEEEMTQMEKRVEEKKDERATLYLSLEQIKQESQNTSVKQNTINMKLSQGESKIQEVKTLRSNLLQEEQEIDEQIANIDENQNSIKLELETSDKLEENLSSGIEKIQAEIDALKEHETIQQKGSESIHLILANLEQKNDFILENTLRIQEEENKLNEELAQLDVNKGNASQEILEKEQKIEEIKTTIDNSKELFLEIENEILQHVAEKENLNKKHKVFLERREEVSKLLSDLDKESFRIMNKKETYQEAENKNIDYMWEEYELTYNQALEIRDKNLTDLSFMKKQIQTLKSEIKALGTVNVNAIEDYKNVADRYEFLKAQKDDLMEAEQTLMQIIEELDTAMRNKFQEEFAKIKEEYDFVFKQLFGGGKGTLELIEDEDILEAGVRIIAQPPGKKLQNMMQLSGGEKALTAISLLFAIQNLKPSPFCLLDEIEAALDDSNVVRFAKYLHKLTTNTQFIVITHRRGTMTAADRLYGITMQEKGVSTLVSVDLLEDKLEE